MRKTDNEPKWDCPLKFEELLLPKNKKEKEKELRRLENWFEWWLRALKQKG